MKIWRVLRVSGMKVGEVRGSTVPRIYRKAMAMYQEIWFPILDDHDSFVKEAISTLAGFDSCLNFFFD